MKTAQDVLTSGTKIDVGDVDIKDDKIIMEDLKSIKQHLTESAWTLLNKEGKIKGRQPYDV